MTDIPGPSSSSDASGSTTSPPGSAAESLSGSEGMAPIQTVARMTPRGSGVAEKYLKAGGSVMQQVSFTISLSRTVRSEFISDRRNH